MQKKYLFSLFMISLLLTGASARQAETYPMSYDQTYQIAIEALNKVGAWRVSQTDQLGGLIVLEKGGYFMPRRTAKVIVKRLEPFRTRVELDESNRSGNDDVFLDAIDRRVKNRASTYPS